MQACARFLLRFCLARLFVLRLSARPAHGRALQSSNRAGGFCARSSVANAVALPPPACPYQR
eukprot:7013260-Alexandrium_andersonii.AAC.1